MSRRPSPSRAALAVAAFALPVLIIPISPGAPELTWSASNQALSLATFAALFAIVAYGLAILMRFADLPSVAHGALWGVGAYTAALAVTELGLGFWPGVVLAALASGAVALGAGLLALRARGMTFLVLTLAIGDLIVLIGLNWDSLTNGSLGLIVADAPDPVPGIDLGGSRTATYFVVLAGLYLTIAAVWGLSRSKIGAVLEAIRDNESLARSFGVNVSAYQLGLFCAAGALVGVAGQLYLAHVKAITPDLFNSLAFIPIFLMVIMGGVNSLAGPAVGAWLIVFLPEWLEPAGLGDPIGQQLIFGLLLVAFILLAPNGLADLVGRVFARRRPTAAPEEHVTAPSTTVAPRPRPRPAAERPRRDGGALLELAGVTRQYGGVAALDDVSLEVRSGEIVGLIGPNGSGKTTAVNCASGFQSLSGGELRWRSELVARSRPDLLVRLGLVRTFQDPRVFASFSVRAHCELGARMSGGHPDIDELMSFWGLDAVGEARAAELSNGQRRNVALAGAMATQPQLMLLDEPAAGLTDTERDALRARLEAVREQGVSLLVVDHTMSFLLPLCDRIVVLDAGKKIAEGTPDEIQEDERVVSAYLGQQFAEAQRSAGAAARALAGASERLPTDAVGAAELRLRVDDLVAGYGEVDVLHGVSLEVGTGDTVAVLGANGAGKTTLLRVMSGLMRPRGGTVSLDDEDVGGRRPDELLRRGIAHVPQDRQVFTEMTVGENIALGHRLRSDRDGIAEDLDWVRQVFPALEARWNDRAGNLSGGQQQMVAIARAVMARPRLLLLDEPTAGLAPRLVDELAEMVRRLVAERGPGLLLVEQDAVLALELTSVAHVLRDGRVIKSAPSGELMRDQSLVRAYLGSDADADLLGARL